MLNSNYRYIHLCQLIEILNGPLPGMQAIRRLDSQFGTTYFVEIFHQKHWPLYVELFALEDILSDIAIDYAAEIYDAADFEAYLDRHNKFSEWDGQEFTPIHDPQIRLETGIDQFEKGWLFGVTRSNLRIELKKNNIPIEPAYGRLGCDTNINLTYALFARRRGNADKLFAYCLYQAIRNELSIKLFDLPGLAGYSLPISGDDFFSLAAPQKCLDLLEVTLDWSFGEGADLWRSPEAYDLLKELINYANLVRSGNWPEIEHTEEILSMALGRDCETSLLSLAAQVQKPALMAH